MLGRDSLDRKFRHKGDALASESVNARRRFTTQDLVDNTCAPDVNMAAAAISKERANVHSITSINSAAHYNNGYTQREIMLDGALTPVGTDLPVTSTKAFQTKASVHYNKRNQTDTTINIGKSKKEEVVLKSRTLKDSMDICEKSETLAPAKSTKQNGVSRVSPRRTASFPSRYFNRVKRDGSTSSKWTAVKHAVKITHTMAKHQKSKQDSFMEK